MILAIDTSAGQCAVALSGERTWTRAEPMTRGHAEALFPLIDRILAEAGVSYADLTRIAVCTGPGSFTGLRVGIAAARGLALGCDIPVIGVSRFAALAEGEKPVKLPGRDGQIYVQEVRDGVPWGEPSIEPGEAEDILPDPTVIAKLARMQELGARPAPLYLRGADALPSRDLPPKILD